MRKLEHKYSTKNSAGYNCIKLGIYFDDGGYNYFNSQIKPRCFYIGARAINRTDGGGYHVEEYAMFDDSELAQACQNVIIKEVPRFNLKKLESYYNSVDWEAYGDAIEKKDFQYINSIIEKLKSL